MRLPQARSRSVSESGSRTRHRLRPAYRDRGAGNAVRNLASVGAGVRFVSVIGDDDSGHQIENLCHGLAEVKLSLVREQNRSTSTKTRFIAHGQQLLRTDKESTHAIAGNTFA